MNQLAVAINCRENACEQSPRLPRREKNERKRSKGRVHFHAQEIKAESPLEDAGNSLFLVKAGVILTAFRQTRKYLSQKIGHRAERFQISDFRFK